MEPISILIGDEAYAIPPAGYTQETMVSTYDPSTKKTTVTYTCNIAITNGIEKKGVDFEIGI
jgi:hypothetical protein